jgi:hypothetical protein
MRAIFIAILLEMTFDPRIIFGDLYIKLYPFSGTNPKGSIIWNIS